MNSLLQKNLISTKEASALSGYNADYLSRLCREKKITSSQVGRTWLIERASLEVFMETQVDRKIELAENLARERELEYRKANSSVAQVSEMANDLENRMRVAASSMLGAFTSVRIPRSMPIMSGQAFAAGLTAVILGASVTLAGSGVVARAGEMLLTSAFEARALTVAAISSSDSVARTKTAEFSKIAEDEIKKIDTTLIRAADARVATLPVTLSEVIENSHEPVVMSELAYARAGEIFETYPKPLTATQIVASLLDTGAHPEETFAAITREALLAYNRLGAYALNDIETVLALHMQGVEVAANGLLSASATTRDIAGRAPLAIGNVFLTASSATLSSYERAIYAYVENIDVVPSTIASTVYGLGNGIGGSVVVGMLSAPVIYEEGVVAFVEESVSAGSFISEGSFAFGKEADRTVSGLLEVEDRAVVQSVEGARLALTSVGNGAASAVLAVESVPSFTTDKILGVMGGIALRIERADASVLSASPLVSLDIDRFIPGFLQNVTAVVAHAVGSAFHGVFGPLAGFFGASEEVGLAVIPNDGSSFSGPDGEVTTEEALRGNTTVYNGPVTIVRNEYPTVNYSGVSQAYVDERLALLRRTLYTRVVDRTSDTIYGEIRDADIIDSRVAGSTFANGAITDSTFTGGTITGSSLNVASTTITGSLTVNGDIAANGITATSSVITNATSTSLFATNATLTNATSTTFYATLATIVDGFFTNLTATLATITNAVIANLTATNATLTNATSTNATSTNLFATNLIATNATSTNLFATGARFTTGIIDALTSPLANITTAVITNLTATNSTLTNATSTNSFALSYLTPSRLLSVGSNGVATSTSLSSWVAGTLNQLTVTDNGTGGITLSLPSTIAIGTSQVTTIRSDGATSTFGGGIQASIVEGGQYIAGPYVLATSTTATSAFSGNIAVGRNATFGTSASDLLTVNSAVASNLIPSANNTYDLGSIGSYWRRGYVDELTVNNLSAASTSIAGTVSSSFTVNADNATADTEDSTLIFNRGSSSPNALMTWNSTTDRFEFNMPVFSADGIFTNATSTTFFTSALKANTFAAGQSASTTISSTGALSTPSLTATNLSITRVPFITTAGLFTDSAAFTFDSSLAKLSVTNASTTNISNSSLTSGRVTYAGTGGLLQDSSNLLFNGTTLTANALSVTNGTTLSGALTYGGVTLSNSVTGTGSMVLSASPTFTGTSVFADLIATNATSTTFFTSTLGLGSGNYFTSLLGNGLTNVGGTLTVSTSSLSSGFFLQGGNSFGTTAILGTNDAQNLAFETGGSTRITVDTSGNVGIGTTTPSSLLDLYKSTDGYAKITVRNPNTGTDALAGLDFVQDLGGAGSLYATGNTFDGNADFGALSGFSNSLWLDASFELTGGLKLVARNGDIGFYAGSRSTQNVTISGTNGNLGVGSTTPYARLSVKGAGTTTGVNFQTTNSSNSPLLTVLDSGNVGIGVTAPDAALTVDVAADNNYLARFKTSDNVSGSFDIFATTGEAIQAWLRGADNVVDIQLASDGVSYFNGGNVGIGTTAPLGKLHVAGTALVGGEPTYRGDIIIDQIGNTEASTGGLEFKADNANSGYGSRIKNVFDGGSAYDLRFQNRTNSAAWTTMMTIAAAGNVGIGTTSPAQNLHIDQGTAATLPIIQLSGAGGTIAKIGRASNFMNAGTAADLAINAPTSQSLYLGVGGSAFVTLNSTGNVGIGTTSPSEKLSVSGNAIVSGATGALVKFAKTNATAKQYNLGIDNDSAFTLFDATTSLTRLYVTTSGNMGIGDFYAAALPKAKLDVVGSLAIGYATSDSFTAPTNGAVISGNVGIGTTSPEGKLDVNAGLGVYSYIGGSTTGHRSIRMGADASGYATIQGTGRGSQIGSFFDITLQPSGGSVGIGTVSPGAALDVRGAASVGGFITTPVAKFHSTNAAAVGTGGIISLGGASGNATDPYDFAFIKGAKESAGANNYAGYLALHTVSGGAGGETNSGDYERLRITSTGNVGIGTTTPLSKLQVSTSGADAYSLDLLTGSSHDTGIRIGRGSGANGAGIQMVTAATDYLSFYVNGSALPAINTAAQMVLTEGGYVGIGTTTPSSLLTVGGSALFAASAAPTLTVKGYSSGSADIFVDTATNYGGFGYKSAGVEQWYIGNNATGANDISFMLGASRTVGMFIRDNATVGIGTTDPRHKLSITDGVAPYTAATGELMQLKRSTTNSLDSDATVLGIGNNSNLFYIRYGGTSDRLGFVDGGAVEVLSLRNGGNVGIGTTNPGSKLEVFGATADGSGVTTLLKLNGAANAGSDGNAIEFLSGTGSQKAARIHTLLTNNDRADIVISNGDGADGYSERLRITSAGNVGIGGISDPDQLLEVNKHNANDAYIKVSTTGTGAGAYFLADSAATGFYGFQLASSGTPKWMIGDFSGGSNLQFIQGALSNTPKMTIDTSGNVGIGATAPGAKLEVTGDTTVSTTNYYGASTWTGKISASSVSTQAGLVLRANAASGNPALGSIHAVPIADYRSGLVATYSADGSGSGYFAVNQFVPTSSATLERFRIDVDGDVGIGATNPGSALEVKRTASNAGIYANYNDTNKVRLEAASNGNAYIGITTGSGSLSIGNTNNADAIFLDAASDVGIGHTNPLYPLDVNGLTLIRGYTVGVTAALADAYKFTHDGGNSFVNNQGGYFGIGTTGPQEKLQILRDGGPAEGTFGLSILSAAAGTELAMGASASSNYSYIQSFQDGISWTNRPLALQPNGGNVGINRISPNEKLHVYDETAVVGNPTVRLESYVGGYGAGIEAGSQLTGGSYLSMGKAVWDGEGSWNTTASTQDSYFTIHTVENGTIGEKLRIKSNGYVGIGNTNPTYVGVGSNTNPLLSVLGPIQGGAAARSATALGSTSAFIDVNGWWGMRSGTDNSFNIDVYNAATPIAALTVLQDGRVGIGTTDPVYKLHVEGNGIFQRQAGRIDNAMVDTSIGGNNGWWDWTLNGALGANIFGLVTRTDGGTFGESALQFTRSGTDVTVASFPNSNVGIGTAGPAFTDGSGLEIERSGTATLRLDSQTYATELRGTTGGTQLYQLSGGYLAFGTNNAEKARFDPNGDFGIGDTDPQAKLAVNGVASMGEGSKLSMIGLDINAQGTPGFVKIVTTIPFASGSADFTVNIKGYKYVSGETTDLKISWHYYLGTFYNAAVTSSGSWAPTVRLSNEGGFVAIVLTDPGYWAKMYVESMYSSNYNDAYASGWSWTDADATGSPIVAVSYKANFGNNFVMNSSGNVGIGTTNPSTGKLEVLRASSDGGVILRIGDLGSAYTNFDFSRASATGALHIQGNQSGADNISLAPTSGNVGIGVTSPNSKLVVAGNIETTSGANRSLILRSSTNYNYNLQTTGDDFQILEAGDTSKVRLHIDYPNGYVGIGTTNPAYKLDVVGSGFVGYHTANATNADFNVSGGSSTSDSIINLGYHQTFDATIWRISRMGSDNQNFRISNWQSGSEVNAFTATNAGDVGIGGATSPEARLDVAGGHIQIDAGKTITINDNDSFTYDSQTMTHYGLGWFSDSWSGGGATSWLSGYGGIKLFTAALPRVSIDTSGNVGIGTISPGGYRLNINAADYSHIKLTNGIPLIKFAGSTFNSGNGAELWQDGGGTFRINMTSGQGGITITSAGLLTFPGYGAGTLVTDSSGNVTASSDERLKDVEDNYTRGLTEIMAINPVNYKWKASTGYDTENTYSGFIAQNIQDVIPEAVGVDPRGFLTLSDRPILAATVNALKELNVRTLSLAPAAENQEAHSLAVSSNASVAGMLTVTGTGTFSDSLTAANVLTDGSVTAFSFLTETNGTLPDEVLTAGNADLFKMASYAITSMQALSARTDLLATRIDEIDARVAALESGSTADEISGAVGLTVATIKSALQTLGIYLENGVAQFETLVFRQLAVAKDTNGDSSAGSETILAGNTVVEVENPYVLPTSKIFVTFTGPIQGAWYISNKEEGKFRVTLATGQSADVSFDYFILQTEGQLASPGAAAPAQTPNDPAPSNEPLLPVFPGEGTGTTTPVMGSGDTTPPSIILNGPAAREIDQGATWIDQGATASDETDGDLTSTIQAQGTVDTSTPGTYTVSYSVADAAGNEAHVSRIVSVQVVSALTAPEPEPAPSQEPASAP